MSVRVRKRLLAAVALVAVTALGGCYIAPYPPPGYYYPRPHYYGWR